MGELFFVKFPIKRNQMENKNVMMQTVVTNTLGGGAFDVAYAAGKNELTKTIAINIGGKTINFLIEALFKPTIFISFPIQNDIKRILTHSKYYQAI